MSEDASRTTTATAETGVRKKRLASGFGLLGAVFLLGILVQHIVSASAHVTAEESRKLAVAAGLVAFVVVAAGGLKTRWLRFFSSNRFAVPLLFSLTALSITGTLILQGQGQIVMGRAYGRVALTMIRGLFLGDLFHGFGFALVLGMAAGGLALVIISRRRLSARRFGSLLAHLGLVVTLAGACLGSVWGIKGRIDLHEGQTTNRFHSTGPEGRMQQHPLGFKLALDDFQIEKYEPDFRLMVFDISSPQQQRLAVCDPAAPDQDMLASYGIKLIAYWPDHFKRDVVEPLPTGKATSGFTAAALVVSAGKDARWLFDSGQADGGRTELAGRQLVFFWEAERAEKFAGNLEAKSGSAPHVIIAGKQRLFLNVGQLVKLPDSDHSLEIKRAFLDFVIDPNSHKPKNRTTRPDNPAVEVIVRDAVGKQIESGWLFAKFPDFHGKGHSELGSLRYAYSGARTQLVDAILVGEKIEIGREIKLGDTSLVVKKLFRNARHRVEDDTRSARENTPLARVEIRGRKHLLYLKPQSPVRLTGDRALLLGPKDGEMVRDYLSRVSVYREAEKVLSRTIEVNSPLSFGGFSIYQADYRPEDPTYSGFEVVSDPGLWIVYLGILLNMMGVFWAMFLPNILKRRGRAAGGGGAP